MAISPMLAAITVLTAFLIVNVSCQDEINLENLTSREELKDILVSIMKKLRLVEEKESTNHAEIARLKKIVLQQSSEITMFKKRLVYQDFFLRQCRQTLKTTIKEKKRPSVLEDNRTNESPDFAIQSAPKQIQTQAMKGANDEQGTQPQPSKSKRLLLGNNEVQSTAHVAFSAYVDHYGAHTPANQVLHFQGVLLNDGNCYNPHTGMFTSPYSGVYLFSVSIATKHTSEFAAKLLVDNVLETGVVAESIQDGHIDQGSNTAIVRLNKGQSVWVVVDTNNNITVESNGRFRFVTFSGTLLYQ